MSSKIKYCIFLLLLYNNSKIQCGESSQKIFVDVRTIDFLDPQKHGFLVILDEYFVKNFLHESQFPTLFVTTLRLSHHNEPILTHQDKLLLKNLVNVNDHQRRFAKIFYPEVIQERKVIKLEKMTEKSWYVICVEFENMNRDNRTTGLTCKMSRTLDKFGAKTESTVNDVEIGEFFSQ